MKKEYEISQNNDVQNQNKSQIVTTNDLLFLHFNLVRKNSYRSYMSFTKKHALNDFSNLLDKLFNKKENNNYEKNDIKPN